METQEKPKKKRLNIEAKIYVTKALARFEKPTALSRAVQKIFGIEVSPSAIAGYDPTVSNGNAKLGHRLRDMFFAERKRFLNEIEALPMAHKAVRLQRLDDQYTAAVEANRIKDAINAVNVASNEMQHVEVVELMKRQQMPGPGNGGSK
ncbi:DUF2280 domain-containing protein [Trinickia mobilis]|uniref:DUF2280 domain-containing protein n=1 Tax=Trinickia mobilis TaxID=2816356 RepID=UPI001A8E83B1|nr:DUF2280 domain-containing protein [Trinickia mobilis]